MVLAVVGVVMIYSATRGKLSLAGLDPHYYLKRQAVFVVLGVVVMVAVALFDYRRLEQISTVLYVGILLALLGVLAWGRARRAPSAGSRWGRSSCSRRSSPPWSSSSPSPPTAPDGRTASTSATWCGWC